MFGKKPINKLELEELYRRHFDNLFTAAQRITQNAALSEDIVQDFFLHLLDVGLPKGHILNPGAYFRTSISRKAIEHINKESKTPKKEINQDLHQVSSEDESSDNQKWIEYKLEDIIQGIQKLPEHHRLVLEKHLFDKLKHEEIAQDLNTSAATVRSHYLRGRKKLIQILESQYHG